jgi:CubicO group peptidase (beta-lactamase class C family)
MFVASPRRHAFTGAWRRAVLLCGAVLLFGCRETGGVPSEPEPPATDITARWNAVDSITRAMIAANPSYGRLTVSVYNANNVRVYERSYGGFSPTSTIAVASASKLIAGTLLLDLVARGELALDRTTSSVLGWTGTRGTITLQHLLSFTSGLTPEAGCTLNPLITLAACVNEIASSTLVAAPGVRFDYGSTHLHVAARMAEVVTGKSWNTLYRERLADPLGIDASSRFFALPNAALGANNPLAAGGLRISARDYARLLAVVFHKGRTLGVAVGTTALFDAQAREPYPTVTVGASPGAAFGFRYGLSAWLQCSTPATGCAVISSPGAFGFTPWIDRQTGYYATIALEESIGSGATFGTTLALLIEPAIRSALSTR